MRKFMCEALSPEGIRCGRYAEYETEDGKWLCESDSLRWVRASNKKDLAREMFHVQKQPAAADNSWIPNVSKTQL